jgi:hypothetical protein
MNGKIYFETLTELAEFMTEYSGTACFEVHKMSSNVWLLEFTGSF